MKNLFVIILLIGSSFQLSAQVGELRVYKWNEVINASPDTIYGLSLAKLKLDSLPQELSKFIYLKRLDLKKNKLTKLPNFIGDFHALETIDLDKNDLIYFPIVFCRMPKLKNILIGNNPFEILPNCISGINSLEYLDLYDTPIISLPASLELLNNLQKVDLSGIKFSPEFQELWLQRMPQVTWDFDPPCACMSQ
ncbi:MAG: hypothetical protein QNK85_09325 [Crocinitomicaceae bacterium]